MKPYQKAMNKQAKLNRPAARSSYAPQTRRDGRLIYLKVLARLKQWWACPFARRGYL